MHMLRAFGLPLGISLAIHAALLACTVAIVWRVARVDEGREIFVSFEDPSLLGAPVTSDTDMAGVDSMSPETSVPVLDVVPTSVSRPSLSTRSDGLLQRSGLETTRPEMQPTVRGHADAGEQGVLEGATPRRSRVRFAGLGSGNARSVVYVLDASGPMVTSLAIVREELLGSVDRLSATQKFAVVAFSRKTDGTARVERFKPVLVRATSRAKQQLSDWLVEIQPGGRSAPLEGLRAAIKYKPDAVFLLCRSIERSGGGVWDLGYDRTMAELDELNPLRGEHRRTTIKTIQFLSEDSTGIMQAIGETHGGGASGYTVVRSTDDLPGSGAIPAVAPGMRWRDGE